MGKEGSDEQGGDGQGEGRAGRDIRDSICTLGMGSREDGREQLERRRFESIGLEAVEMLL